jgi:branched-chain amino acid transport system permease protein
MNGLSFAAVLFLLAAGLSVIQGLMGILNLAHGGFYMVGAYVGLSLARMGWNFGLACLGGALAGGVVGLLIERGFLQRLYKLENAQVLLTLGFVYVIINLIQWIWGGTPGMPYVPPWLAGSIQMGTITYPIYRFYLIIVGLVIAAILWWAGEKTRVGAIVRAGTDDKEMIMGMGINLGLVFMSVFFVGAFIAGFAGSVGVTVLGAYLDVGWDALFLALAVIVVGGMGSVAGALLASVLIGIIDSYGKAFFPNFASFTIYFIFVVVLLVRPAGLLGKRA